MSKTYKKEKNIDSNELSSVSLYKNKGYSDVTFASKQAALGRRDTGFSFYLELVYNLLFIKARTERDLEPGLLRADVGRIEMSEWREFGFERIAEKMPAAFLGAGHAELTAPGREEGWNGGACRGQV